jgi:hypothetical protein
MRVRKPCVRLRRRLLGWNVRLLIGLSRCSVSSRAWGARERVTDVSDPPTLRGQSQPEQTLAQKRDAGPCSRRIQRSRPTARRPPHGRTGSSRFSVATRTADARNQGLTRVTTDWTRATLGIAAPTSTNAI